VNNNKETENGLVFCSSGFAVKLLNSGCA